LMASDGVHLGSNFSPQDCWRSPLCTAVAVAGRPAKVASDPMITGELKSKVDRIWDAFWSGGIANPLEVMEQITYLLFIRRLDDLQTARRIGPTDLESRSTRPSSLRGTTTRAARTRISVGRGSRIGRRP
jgi:hypothetical protein